MRWVRHGGSVSPTPSAHRLRLGLPGYLILFAPPAFAPQRQLTAQEAAFAIGVLPDICAFHRYTGNSASPYRTQAAQFGARPGVEPRDLTPRLDSRLRALYAQ